MCSSSRKLVAPLIMYNQVHSMHVYIYSVSSESSLSCLGPLSDFHLVSQKSGIVRYFEACLMS